MRPWHLATLACVALVAGCEQTHDPTFQDGDDVGSEATTRNEATSATVNDREVRAAARLIALAMDNRAVRGGVRDAMRSSPLTEHKLVFGDFLGTPAGQTLVREAARAGGMKVASVQASLGHLPALDFYVPARVHRLAWRGTEDYLVGASVAGKAPSTVFDRSGVEVAVRLDQAASGGSALLMLQSAERKSRRVRPQSAVTGPTIQDPDDGELSGSLTETDASGRSVTTELAALMAPRLPLAAFCTGCPPPPLPPPPPSMRLSRIQTQGICDNANCSEGNEFEFKSIKPDGGSSTRRIENIPSTTNMARSDVMIYTTPAIVGTIRVEVKETDFSSGDDNFAYVTYNPNYVGPSPVTASDNGRSWPMKEQPRVGVFDPYTLAAKFTW